MLRQKRVHLRLLFKQICAQLRQFPATRSEREATAERGRELGGAEASWQTGAGNASERLTQGSAMCVVPAAAGDRACAHTMH